MYRALREAPDTSVIVDAAHEAFTSCYPDLKLQPLVVVIAALNEAGNFSTVLDEVPGQTGDLPEMVRIVEEDRADLMSTKHAPAALRRTIVTA